MTILHEETDWEDAGNTFGTGEVSFRDIENHFGRQLFATNKVLFEKQMWGVDVPVFDLSLYTVMGQMQNIKSMRFNIHDRIYDYRVNAAIFMPSGSGKGGMFNHIGTMSEMLGLDYYEVGEMTDSALLGQYNTVEQFNKKNDMNEKVKVLTPGVLDPKAGHNILAMNECDILFKAKSSSFARNAMTHYQKAMNTIGTHDNVLSKDTSAGGRIKFNSDVSFFFTSKLPDHFYEVIMNTGFLQRCTTLNLPKSWKQKRADDSQMLEGLDSGGRTSLNEKYIELIDGMRKIDEFYQDITHLPVSSAAKKMLKTTASRKLHDPLDDMGRKSQSVLQTFTSRYQEFVIRYAHLNAVSRLSPKVQQEDVAYAISFIIPLWKNIVYFIEDGLKPEQNEVIELRTHTAFIKRIYLLLSERIGKKWIPLNSIIKIVASKEYGWNVSRPTALKRVKRVVDSDHYRTKTQGHAVLIRYYDSDKIK